MSPGTKDDLTKTLFTKSSVEDYRKLCDMEVLGLDNRLDGEGAVYQDFKEQLITKSRGMVRDGVVTETKHGQTMK